MDDIIGLRGNKVGHDYLHGDNPVTLRGVFQQLGTFGQIGGGDLTEVDHVYTVLATGTAPANEVIVAWSPNLNLTGTGWALQVYMSTSGTLIIRQFNADGSGSRIAQVTTFGSTYAGQSVRLTIAIKGGTADIPSVWANGVLLTGFTTFTNGSNPPDFFFPANVAATYYVRGFGVSSSYYRPGRPVNRYYTQADVDFVQRTGRLPGTDAIGYSATQFVTGDSSSFATSVGSWSAVNSGVVTWNSTVPGMDIVSSSSAAGSGVRLNCGTIIGRRYRISFTVSNLVGSFLVRMSRSDLAGNLSLNQVISANGNYVFEVVTVDAGGGNTPTHVSFLDQTVPDTFTATISNFKVTDVGALTDPIIQPCRILDDATNNGLCAYLVGYTPITQKKNWRVVAIVDMSTTGNKQLFGSPIFTEPDKQVIDTIEDSLTGSPTYSVGDGSGPAYYVGDTARTPGRRRLTLATNFPANSARVGIYANVTVTGGNAEKITITGHRSQ